jgi:hypothetical protein
MDPIDTWGHGGRRAIAAGLALGILVACGGEEPRSSAELDALRTKIEIAEYAGGDAARCVFSAPDLELCTWRIEEGQAAWAALSQPGIGGDLNLLCELPIDGSPRADGSCRAHPRSSQAAARESALPPVSAAGSLEGRSSAEQRLAEALTVRALSDLVGDAPDRCKTNLESQTCEWSVGEDAAGYGLLAALVDDAGSGSVVRLRCAVPLDGSARATDSCGATWAEGE